MRAFLFPGQGSQKVGMGVTLCEAYPAAQATFAEADEVLGYALSRLCREGSEAELGLTANAQPAILTTSVAALRVLTAETGITADVVAGHSLGEFSALVAAEALTFADAVKLVHLRGKFMQDAVPAGAGGMAAVLGMSVDDIAAVCAEVAAETGLVIAPANLNGGGQVVIAGAKAAIDRAAEVLKQKGAKRVVPLQVSAPFHCALMQPAADRLAAELERIKVAAPKVPVITNVEAEPNQDPARVRALLVAQVTAPVRWEQSMQKLAAMGCKSAIEVGAGSVLAGLIKRIAPDIVVQGAGDPEAMRSLSK